MKTNLFATLMCLTKGALIVTLVLFVGGCSGLGSLQPISMKLPPFVKATGIGQNKEEATKNAFREAVQIAVGTVVDSETIIRNDKVIKDEIIDYSRGFVESHKVLSEGKNKDGLYEVTIRATVKDRQLYEKLRRFQPASAKVEGSNIFGAVTSRMESRKKAAKLLAKSLEATDLPLPLLKTEFLSKKPKILEENAESILAEWKVRISFDQKLYKEKVYPWLSKLFSDIATDQKKVSVSLETFEGAIGFPLEDGVAYRSLPEDWRKKDLLVVVSRGRGFLGLSNSYDVYWVPSTAAGTLAKASSTASSRVSGLVLELKDKDNNVVLSQQRDFSPWLGDYNSLIRGRWHNADIRDDLTSKIGIRRGFEDPDRYYRPPAVDNPILIYHSKQETAFLPVFLLQRTGRINQAPYFTYMNDSIVVRWRLRVPLETIKKTKDVNCRIAP